VNFNNRAGRVRLTALVGVLALLAAACSSSSKSTGSTSGTTSAAGATGGGSHGAPFKIGYIEDAVSLGAGANNPYTIPAFQAWAKWQTANGGINGHPVQVVVEREPNNPGVALTDVQKLVGEGIVVLVEDDVTDTQSWIPFIKQAGVPVIAGTSPSTASAGAPTFFSTIPSILLTPQMVVASAAKAGSNKLASFYCAEIPACGELVPALSAVGKKAGVSVPFGASILGSAPNYTAQCLAAKEHGADSLFVADASQIILRVAASCAQQGYVPHEIMSSTNMQQNMAGTPGMEGSVVFDGVAPFFDTSFSGVATMIAAYNQYDPGLTKDPQYGDLSTEQWTDGLLIAEAAKAGAVGTTSPLSAASMLNGIYVLGSTNLGGMTPTLTFQRGQAQLNRCWFWVEIQNGKYTLTNGLTPNCVPQ
jgi:branched-chain amino acid transport system substrate-binding protein